MDSTITQIEADRIALRKMFKAIAEYGREVRLRRQAAGGLPIQEPLNEAAPEHKLHATHRQKHRKKKVAI